MPDNLHITIIVVLSTYLYGLRGVRTTKRIIALKKLNSNIIISYNTIFSNTIDLMFCMRHCFAIIIHQTTTSISGRPLYMRHYTARRGTCFSGNPFPYTRPQKGLPRALGTFELTSTPDPIMTDAKWTQCKITRLV